MKYTATFDIGEESVSVGIGTTVSIDGKGEYRMTAITFDDLHDRVEKARELLESIVFGDDDVNDVPMPIWNKINKALDLI